MKRFISLLLIAYVAVNNLFAYDLISDNLCYNKLGSTVAVVGYYSNLTDVIIPSSVTIGYTTYTVTSIGDKAFSGCTGLTSVTIPESVKSIGERAFENCTRLTSVTIPASVTRIWGHTFEGCTGLTSITIPYSVTYIGERAFSGCTGLTKTNYNGSIAGWCNINFGDNPIQYSHNLYINNVEVKDLVIPNWDWVTAIKGSAFLGCTGLTSVTIGNSVTSIGERAFENCAGLTSITIPSSVTSIGERAFENCTGLTSVTIGNNVTSIGERAFENCTGITSITIPNSVTSIGVSAFEGCTGLTKTNYNGDIAGWCNIDFDYYSANPVWYSHNLYINDVEVNDLVIPDGVTAIKNYTFSGCTGLTSVTIGNTVTSIGSSAFRDCSSLTSITIPNSVTRIGGSAFYGCTGLTKTNYNGDIAGWCSLYFGSAGANPMSYSHNLYINDVEVKDLVIPDGIIAIKNYAFCMCEGLTSLAIPNSVTSIGESAFESCTGLTSVTIPNSVTSIGHYTFYGCSGLTSVTIPNSVTRVGHSAFNSCTSLTSVVWNAQKCTNFSINLYGIQPPFDSVSSNITSFTFGDEVETIPTYLCYGLHGLSSITIPKNVTSIGACAFEDCTGLFSVTIGDGVTSIGNSAFYGCCGLTSVTIPNSVTSIGDYAFSGCTGLTTITCEAITTPTCGSYTFKDIPTDIPVYIPCGTSNAYRYARGWEDFTNQQEPPMAYSITVLPNNENNGRIWMQDITRDTNCEITAVFSAMPYGCDFRQWSDGNTDNPRTIVLTQDTVIYAQFIRSYTITTSCNSWQGTVTGDGTYDEGTEITLTATPNNGYRFTQWSDGNTDNPRVVTVNADATYYTALFEEIYYTINTTCDATQGTVTGGGRYTIGNLITLVATPNTGYEFIQWSDGNTENPRVVTVSEDATYEALFEKVYFTVTTNCNAAQGTVTTGGTFYKGTSVTLTATANTGYRFSQWSDGNTDNPRVLTVDRDTTCTALFESVFYTLTATCEPAQGAVTGGGTFQEGTTVTLTATPNDGYRFGQWSDGNTDNPRTVTVTEDKTYTAEFIKLCIITADCDAAQGTVTGDGTYDEGTTVTLTATPNDGYRFGQWSDGNTDNPRTVTATEDKTYTAEFVKLCIITVDCDAAQGIVTGSGTYDEGKTITLTATPNDGYRFGQWNDGNTDNPRAVTATEDKNYTAEFVKLCIITADCDAAQGTVTGGGTYDEGTTVTLTATPNKGYVFARWDDNNTDNPRSVVVLADAAYTAFFDEEQTALDQVGADGTAAQKIIRNGQVLIQRGDKLYTLTGQEIIKH